VPKV
jgi:hypothetical protein